MIECWIYFLLGIGIVVDVPRSDAVAAGVATVDPLIEEAADFVASQRIKKKVEKLIERKGIKAVQLPYPAEIPHGTVELKIDQQQVRLGKKIFTRVNWAMKVPDKVNEQFTYHVFVAHIENQKNRVFRHTWGIVSVELNEQEHAIMSDSVASQIGDYRVLTILAAWSIKTEQAHILDVTEAEYLVVTK